MDREIGGWLDKQMDEWEKEEKRCGDDTCVNGLIRNIKMDEWN